MLFHKNVIFYNQIIIIDVSQINIALELLAITREMSHFSKVFLIYEFHKDTIAWHKYHLLAHIS